ncbi:MAG: twin-arginine translocase subunit TatC [Gammaproteobacteria bacterium]|nr:twin-arginine translocase subunit TatC [Gammaproteobacteria bacterium]
MKNSQPIDAADGGFVSHLIELRNRLLYIAAGIIPVLLLLLPFANKLYSLLALPLTQQLPEGATMIAVDIVTPFLIPFKFVALLAIFITVPFTLYHIWAFVAPGLYQREKKMVAPLMVSSTVLFYLGVTFAYLVVFPLVFAFIISTAPAGITVMPDIARYLDFAMALFLAFGVAFEIPVAIVLLVAIGVTTPAALAGKRPYIIVAAFIIGMLLTPPDVVSQILLAVPMWILYESGIIASRFMLRRRGNDVNTESAS